MHIKEKYVLDLYMKLFYFLEQKNWMVKKLRKMRLFEICLLTLFIMVLLLSIIFAVVLHMSQVSLVLLLIDFPIAVIVAIYGSLSIREEEEET